LQHGELYQIHSNQIEAPELITDAWGTVVWRWAPKPFGDSLADEDPDGDGQRLTLNLRFPGQYFDAETGCITTISGITIRRRGGILRAIR
jgi:uncharacterized protein RhaS with RHS repeats